MTTDFRERLQSLVDRVETKPTHRFVLGLDGDNEITLFLHVLTKDTTQEGDRGRLGGPKGTGPGETYTVNFYLPFSHAESDEEIFERMLKISLLADHHETQEWFRVDGKIYKDPHLKGLFSMVPINQRGFERRNPRAFRGQLS